MFFCQGLLFIFLSGLPFILDLFFCQQCNYTNILFHSFLCSPTERNVAWPPSTATKRPTDHRLKSLGLPLPLLPVVPEGELQQKRYNSYAWVSVTFEPCPLLTHFHSSLFSSLFSAMNVQTFAFQKPRTWSQWWWQS